LGQQLADILLKPGKLRDRLTEGVYIPTDETEAVALLDDALEKSAAAEPATQKLRAAMKAGTLSRGDPEDAIEAGVSAGIITAQEAAVMHSAIAARKVVIQVDEFLPEYLTKEHKKWGNNNLDGVAGQSM
jgi:acyl-CoA dehydrogenase